MTPDNISKSDDQDSPPPTPSSVTQCGLELTEVRLLSLICSRHGGVSGNTPSTANLKCNGIYVPDSLTDTDFRALVSWSVDFPEGTKSPIAISGQHALVFTVKDAINEITAEYYAKINSVILIYPYLRQLIDELSVKSLGRNIMIRPLDVPKFVQRLQGHGGARHQLPESDNQRTGADSDGQDATG
jgi:preprotein translocase subunit SecB